jgi:leucyl aminopeptidase
MNHIYVPKAKITAELYVIAVGASHTSDHPFLSHLDPREASYVRGVLKNFSSTLLEYEKLTLPSHPSRAILVLGLGEEKDWNHRRMARAARKIVQLAKQYKKKSCALLLDDMSVSGCSMAECAMRIVQNVEMAHYAYREYVTEPKEGWPTVREIQYCTRSPRAAHMDKALEQGRIIGEQINLSRDLANTPGGDMTPRRLAEHAAREGKKYGVSVTVLGEKQMEKLGMGAILGVSRGSAEEAQFIVMEYKGGTKNTKPIVFIGKGITYDSGGLNLKPSAALDEMHMDMSGGAAVIAAISGIARLKERVHVVGLIPAVENMPSGSSYRPGDVLRSMSGITIEIGNTDAEGRVVLADALTYAKRYDPQLVVDIATLTGASMVALGPHASAIFSRDVQLVEQLRDSGEQSGDYLWPLPMWEEYEDELKGTVGDIRNAKKTRDAGATNGALFLYQFAKDFPRWAHIDIAPTMTGAPSHILGTGSRGSGTALLIEIARRHKSLARR